MLFKNLKIEEFKEFHREFDEDVFANLNLLMSLSQELVVVLVLPKLRRK